MSPRIPRLTNTTSNRPTHNLAEQIGQIMVSAAEVPPQIRIGDEPTVENFTPANGPGRVMPTEGLWTTTLRRHGPLWHFHLPRQTDSKPWWRLIPQPNVRIACIDQPSALDLLVSEPSADPYTIPWGHLSEIVNGVWLSEQGFDRLQTFEEENHPHEPYSSEQIERYAVFEKWASGCILWLNWCFESVELYRHKRHESLYSPPFSCSR